MKQIQILLLILICLLPLIPAVGSFEYEQIKVGAFLLIVSLGVGLAILNFSKWQNLKLVDEVTFAGGLFVIILFVTSLIGVDSQASLTGRSPYFQGWLVYFYLFLFYLLIRLCQFPINFWKQAVSISAVTLAVIALIQWIELTIFHLPVPTYSGRVIATLGSPNLYSGWLLLALPWVYTKRSATAVIILAIVASQSRTAIFLTAGLGLIWLLWQVRLWLRVVLIIFIIASISWATWFSYNYYGPVYTEVVQPFNNWWLIRNAPEKRILIWPILLEQIRQSPIYGFGLENVQLVYDQYFDTPRLYPAAFSLKVMAVDRAHNYSMDLLLSSGLFGFLSWLLLIILTLLRVRDRKILLSLLIYLVWLQFQIPSIIHLVYLWGLIGLTTVLKYDQNKVV